MQQPAPPDNRRPEPGHVVTLIGNGRLASGSPRTGPRSRWSGSPTAGERPCLMARIGWRPVVGGLGGAPAPGPPAGRRRRDQRKLSHAGAVARQRGHESKNQEPRRGGAPLRHGVRSPASQPDQPLRPLRLPPTRSAPRSRGGSDERLLAVADRLEGNYPGESGARFGGWARPVGSPRPTGSTGSTPRPTSVLSPTGNGHNRQPHLKGRRIDEDHDVRRSGRPV